jgi:signal transduction histidine kinase
VESIAAPMDVLERPLRRPVAVTGVTIAATLAALGTAAGFGQGEPWDRWSVLRGAVVAAYTLVGAHSWWRRPHARLGLYVAGIGLLYAVASLSASSEEPAQALGRVTLAASIVATAYVFLSFPHDALTSRPEGRFIRLFAQSTGLLWLLALPTLRDLPAGGPLTDCVDHCPDNPFMLVEAPDAIAKVTTFAINLVTTFALLWLIGILLGKLGGSARLRRGLVVPLVLAVVALAFTYAWYAALRQWGVEDLDVLRYLGAASALAVPLAILIGEVRGRMFAATRLGELVERGGRGPATPWSVERLLRNAIGDPSLVLAVRASSGNGFVDVHGDPIEPLADPPATAVTKVVRDGAPVLALVHDASIDAATDGVDALAATVHVLLENAQLVDDLRASRARIVERSQRERLMLERNLHDGAQQRLFVIQLRLEASRALARDPELLRELNALAGHAAAAVQELRAVAHGISPTVVRERGLADGLRDAALTAVLPVSVVDSGVGRCPPDVELAVYYCALEAIQNAGKHAGADARVVVTLGRRGDELVFSIADDGVGFEPAPRGEGIGLVTMHDRIRAVGGELHVVSEPKQGTTVHGVVPLTPVEATP